MRFLPHKEPLAFSLLYTGLRHSSFAKTFASDAMTTTTTTTTTTAVKSSAALPTAVHSFSSPLSELPQHTTPASSPISPSDSVIFVGPSTSFLTGAKAVLLGMTGGGSWIIYDVIQRAATLPVPIEQVIGGITIAFAASAISTWVCSNSYVTKIALPRPTLKHAAAVASSSRHSSSSHRASSRSNAPSTISGKKDRLGSIESPIIHIQTRSIFEKTITHTVKIANLRYRPLGFIQTWILAPDPTPETPNPKPSLLAPRFFLELQARTPTDSHLRAIWDKVKINSGVTISQTSIRLADQDNRSESRQASPTKNPPATTR
ncbi:hypothetical protein BASA50_010653 [Batrachochytrium salamandrivorans]|uniref:Uncharacterized protein n=1 Tax=Batrachochytrium salamandrivorans TaxID=1357716 RepID=A0ABQ8EYD9_9FUNG|nr:hypothetical protein BASA50_010653 [Batrachochytrium salamandrivorans]